MNLIENFKKYIFILNFQNFYKFTIFSLAFPSASRTAEPWLKHCHQASSIELYKTNWNIEIVLPLWWLSLCVWDSSLISVAGQTVMSNIVAVKDIQHKISEMTMNYKTKYEKV